MAAFLNRVNKAKTSPRVIKKRLFFGFVVLIAVLAFWSLIFDKPAVVAPATEGQTRISPRGGIEVVVDLETDQPQMEVTFEAESVVRVNPAILDQSKWILTKGIKMIEVDGVCYGNAQLWDVWSKTGSYKSCTTVDVDLMNNQIVPETLAVLPKGSTLPGSHFYTENLLSLKELPEGKIWVCSLTSNEEIEVEGEQKTVKAFSIKVLQTSDALSGYAGGCYMVNSSQEWQTVTFFIKEVNANAPLLSPIYLKADGWSGSWFGKSEYNLVP